jgi:hypothetical protein
MPLSPVVRACQVSLVQPQLLTSRDELVCQAGLVCLDAVDECLPLNWDERLLLNLDEQAFQAAMV